MKRFPLFVICLSLLSQAFAASKSDFKTTTYSNVDCIGLVKPLMSDYPYLAVTVYFRNEGLLGDKDFIGRFNSVKSVLAQATVKYGNAVETAPLFFLKKESGVFSTNVFQDRTLVRKVPIAMYGANQPTLGISLDTQLKNDAVSIFQTISKQIAPIIANPTSLYGPAAPQQLFKFLTDVVGQFKEVKSVSSSVGLDAIKPTDDGIKPLSYDVIIIQPGDITLAQGNLKIVTDPADHRLKVYKDGVEFTACPYFIVESGLSNYLDIVGTPSKFYAARANCNITASELAKLTNDYQRIQANLTDAQQAAESYMLKLYESKVALEDGLTGDKSKLTAAYDALYLQEMGVNEANINPVLYNEHYRKQLDDFKVCMDKTSSRLSFYMLVKPALTVLGKTMPPYVNKDMGELQSYCINTQPYVYLSNCQLSQRVAAVLSIAEYGCYVENFSSYANQIANATVYDVSLDDANIHLSELKTKFDRCKKCVEEANKAQLTYAKLRNDAKEKRTASLSMASDANDTYVAALAMQDKLHFLAKQNVIPATPAIVNDTLAVQAAIKNLKLNKDKLNAKLKDANWGDADLTSVNTLFENISVSKNAVEYMLRKSVAPASKAMNMIE